MTEPDTLSSAKDILFVFGVVLAGGALGGALAKRLRLPDVVVYLLVGIVLGPEVLAAIDVDATSNLNQVILIFGASYILFDGGASLRFAVLRRVWVTILLLSTLGVLVAATITSSIAYFGLGIPVMVAMLLGATLASTDPATLVPLFKQISVHPKLSQTIMSESAFNDATGAILTFTILALATGNGYFSLTNSINELIKQVSLGIFIGTVAGGAFAVLIGHHRFGFLADFGPIVTLMAVAGAYLAADNYHASGFMAVFMFGMMIGNPYVFGLKMSEHAAIKMSNFVAEMALIMRLMIFVLLGSQVSFSLVAQYWLAGGILVLGIMFIGRPATVFLSTWLDPRARWTFKEQLFLCWTRETGVIPAALAGMLLALHAPGAQMIVAITFIAVLLTILIQAPTTRWLARRLGVLEKPLDASKMSL